MKPLPPDFGNAAGGRVDAEDAAEETTFILLLSGGLSEDSLRELALAGRPRFLAGTRSSSSCHTSCSVGASPTPKELMHFLQVQSRKYRTPSAPQMVPRKTPCSGTHSQHAFPLHGPAHLDEYS